MEEQEENFDDENFCYKSIESGEINCVKRFLERNSLWKFVFNPKYKSAAATSLMSKQLEMYEYLLSVGCGLAPHEDLYSIVKEFSPEMRKALREIHKRYMKDPNLKHLTTLVTRSRLNYDASEKELQTFREVIATAFNELNEIKLIEPVLKVVANAEDFTIIFDMKSDSVERVDPTNDKTDKGVYYPGGFIYIGASGLLSQKQERFNALGTMAHELTHYAMKLVYRNRSKPYLRQHEPHEEFEAIMQICMERKEAEKFIEYVFGYVESRWHAELIVRVPHLQALYKKDQIKLEMVQAKFRELFEFYELKTLVDLEREYPMMEARRIVRKLNKLSELSAPLRDSEISFNLAALTIQLNSNEISVVYSSFPQLTVRAMFQQFWNEMSCEESFESQFLFLKIDSLKSDEMFDLTFEALNVCTKPTVIVDCGEQSQSEISAVMQKLQENELNQRIAFVQRSHSNDEIEITHTWGQITKESQKILYERTINFQGEMMSLRTLFPFDADAVDAISLKDLLDGNVRIGNEFKFYNDYIERTFLTQDATEIDAEEMLIEADGQKAVLLSNEPGMGKTIELQTMAKRIKRKFISSWVVFIDLKAYIKSYEKDGKVSNQFRSVDEIREYLLENILRIKNFEAAVFVHLFNSNRVVLLMDGFDEISPSFKEFNLGLSAAVKEKTKNQLWISTRPHLQKELQQRCGLSAYKLQPFRKQDRTKYIQEKFKAKNLNSEEMNKKLNEIEEFLTALETNSHLWGTVSNPIILRLVVEIFDDDEEVKLVQSNFYSIYESFSMKMINIFATKGLIAQKELGKAILDSTDLTLLHQKIAFQIIFREDKQGIEKVLKLCFKDPRPIVIEQILRVGLIALDDFGNFQFIHQTFAEFFIANFFFKQIFADNIRSDDEDFNVFLNRKDQTASVLTLFRFAWLDHLYNGPFKMSRMFLDSSIELFNVENDDENFQQIKKTFSHVFPSQHVHSAFLRSIIDNLTNFMNIILVHLVDDFATLYLKPKSGVLNIKNALMFATEHQSFAYVEKILLHAREVLDVDVYKEMFLEKDMGGQGVAYYAGVKNQFPNILEFLLNSPLLPLNDQEVKDWLRQKDFWHNNIFLSAGSLSVPQFTQIYKVIEKKCGKMETKNLLTARCKGKDTCLLKAMVFKVDGDTLKSYLEFLRQTLQDNSDDLKSLVLHSNNQGTTALMKAAEVLRNEKSFTYFWKFLEELVTDEDELKRHLIKTDQKNFTVLHIATRNPNEKIFEFVWESLTKLLDSENLQQLILSPGPQDENILFYAMIGFKNIKTIKSLWASIQSLFDKESLKKIMLKQNELHLTFCENKKVENYDEKMETFKPFIDTNFNEDERKQLLRQVIE